MKTVVFNSPYLDVVEFPDARLGLKRGVPTQVTDEQAEILRTNPDVTVSDAAPAASVAPAPASAPVRSFLASAPSEPDEVK